MVALIARKMGRARPAVWLAHVKPVSLLLRTPSRLSRISRAPLASQRREAEDLVQAPGHNPLRDERPPVEHVLSKMEAHSIKRLPIMRGTQMVGIVSRSALMRGLMRSLRKVSASSCPVILL